MNFSANVGGYSVLAKGDLALAIQPTYDQFSLSAAGSTNIGGNYQEQITGLINGKDVWSIFLNVVDNVSPIDMLSSTSLPTSPDFIGKANLVHLEIESYNQSGDIVKDFAPGQFSLTTTAVVPEPATGRMVPICLALIVTSAVVLKKNSKSSKKAAVLSRCGVVPVRD